MTRAAGARCFIGEGLGLRHLLTLHGRFVGSSRTRPVGVLTVAGWSNYSNYVKTKLVRIGNSRGVRIPQGILRLYGLKEGSVLDIEERREGLLLRVAGTAPGRQSWTEAYREMATESSEAAEWAEWDATAGDGDAG